MSGPAINGSAITKRCRHCSNPLYEVPVRSGVINSPFTKNEPALVCEVCDAPGQLPVVPNA